MPLMGARRAQAPSSPIAGVWAPERLQPSATTATAVTSLAQCRTCMLRALLSLHEQPDVVNHVVDGHAEWEHESELSGRVHDVDERRVIDQIGRGRARHHTLLRDHAVGLAHVGKPSGGARQRREAAAERIDVLAEPRRRIAFRVHRDEKRLEAPGVGPEAASDLGELGQGHGADVWAEGVAKRDGHDVAAQPAQAKVLAVLCREGKSGAIRDGVNNPPLNSAPWTGAATSHTTKSTAVLTRVCLNMEIKAATARPLGRLPPPPP